MSRFEIAAGRIAFVAYHSKTLEVAFSHSRDRFPLSFRQFVCVDSYKASPSFGEMKSLAEARKLSRGQEIYVLIEYVTPKTAFLREFVLRKEWREKAKQLKQERKSARKHGGFVGSPAITK